MIRGSLSKLMYWFYKSRALRARGKLPQGKFGADSSARSADHPKPSASSCQIPKKSMFL